MTATPFTPVEATIGGVMIGIASAWALALNGKVPSDPERVGGITAVRDRSGEHKPLYDRRLSPVDPKPISVDLTEQL